jgi:hypothetical protein
MIKIGEKKFMYNYICAALRVRTHFATSTLVFLKVIIAYLGTIVFYHAFTVR